MKTRPDRIPGVWTALCVSVLVWAAAPNAVTALNLKPFYVTLGNSIQATTASENETPPELREELMPGSITWSELTTAWEQLMRRARELALTETWAEELRLDWKSGRADLITFLIFLGAFLYVLAKFRYYLQTLPDKAGWPTAPNGRLGLQMLGRSILLAGTVLLAFLVLASDVLFDTAPFYRLVFISLLIVLFTRWGKDFALIVFKTKAWLNAREAMQIARLATAIRYLAIFYLILEWLTRGDTVLRTLFRLGAEILLILWLAFYWKKRRQRLKPGRDAGSVNPLKNMRILSAWSYAVAVGGMVLDLAGYPSLSVFWLSCWGATAVVLLWALLIFLILREWRLRLQSAPAETAGESYRNHRAFRWFALQVSWVLWFLGGAFCLIFIWGGKRTVTENMLFWLNYPVSLGKISFSVINFVYAFLILALTRVLTKTWRYVLREKILLESGLDSGLQDSIVTVTVYALWVFGLLLSLHVFGFGTPTLALGFGALGIGLGFGLQNIFNNFISGIILLFERPIQVGDDVEINGIWATVKKINVRATVVQTYDNASLIIPNSEFISSQVTNWSFKDKRLRRNVDVGVAYGSDIELVRKTLLEIAAGTPHVLKSPQPDVLFRDFGDSALVFRLRIWTDIDNMLKVETAVRFEIDRLFKERGIAIAFPQRDVHLFQENGPQTGK